MDLEAEIRHIAKYYLLALVTGIIHYLYLTHCDALLMRLSKLECP